MALARVVIPGDPLNMSNERAAPDASGEPKKRILVVDDTKPIRILILKTFQKEYEIYLEADGQEALETVRESDREMDLVILDHDMPKLNGYQFLRLLRRLDPKVPVIMVSGSLDEKRLRKVRAAGVTNFLAKPVNLKRLREAIERILRGGAGAPTGRVDGEEGSS